MFMGYAQGLKLYLPVQEHVREFKEDVGCVVDSVLFGRGVESGERGGWRGRGAVPVVFLNGSCDTLPLRHTVGVGGLGEGVTSFNDHVTMIVTWRAIMAINQQKGYVPCACMPLPAQSVYCVCQNMHITTNTPLSPLSPPSPHAPPGTTHASQLEAQACEEAVKQLHGAKGGGQQAVLAG